MTNLMVQTSTKNEHRSNSVAAKAKEIDVHVGHRIRKRRTMLGLTQQQMANMIGVTYQQAHKYERGINRISAGRLYQIAGALAVEVAYFYEGIDEGNAAEIEPLQRICLEVARNFTQISNERHQLALSSLARALAEK